MGGINGKLSANIRGLKQPTLFETPPLVPIARLKSAMKVALEESSMSRSEVVDDINRMAQAEGLTTNGRKQAVTEALLDKWVAPSANNDIPIKYLPIFCYVTGSLAPLAALAAPLKATVISEDEAGLLLKAKIDEEISRLKLQKKQIEAGRLR